MRRWTLETLSMLTSACTTRRQCSLHKFEVAGGLVSGTESSRGRISLQRPNRQWECVLSLPKLSATLDVELMTPSPCSYPAAWPPQCVKLSPSPLRA